MRYLVLALLAVPLLASCSSGGGGGSSSTPPATTLATDTTDTSGATPSAVARPTPREWTVSNAQLHFVADTTAGNGDIGKLIALYQAKNEDVAAWDHVCKSLAQDNATLAHQLHEGLWPASAKPAVAAYETALLKQRAVYLQCATSTSLAQIFAAAKTLPSTAAEAEAVRVKLGLPATGK